MPLGTVDFLACVIAPGLIALGALDALTVQDGGTGLGFAPFGQTELSAQGVMQGGPEAGKNPIAVIGINDRPGRKVLGKVAPLASGADRVKHTIEDFAIRIVAGPARPGKRLEVMINQFPLLIRQIRGITYFCHSPSLAEGVGQILSNPSTFLDFFEFSNTL